MLMGIFGAYFKYSQNKIEEQSKVISTQEIAIKSLTVTLNAVKDDIKKQIILNEELQVKQDKIVENSKKLSKILGKHDLEHLARSKPGIVEKIINNGTAKVLKQLEEISK